ncbi:MAG TPA: redox-regulated ATPase YchF [Elusimicrobia bacterium]|nr:redox-regulated ATPase YchF [Elusimicrobiota bacterium]
MKIAMLGLQGAGKKTLFKLTTGTSVTSVPPKGVPGMFEVKDPRVDALSALYHPERTIYARIDVVLLPDVEKTQGKAAWLEDVRNVDGICCVARAFEDPSVFHPAGSVDPKRDLDLFFSELLFADILLMERRKDALASEMRAKSTPEKVRELQAVEKVSAELEAGKPYRTIPLTPPEKAVLSNTQFLTAKAVAGVVNLTQDRDTAALKAAVEAEFGSRMTLSFFDAKLEAEIAAISDAAERKEFLSGLGIEEPAVAKLTRAVYDALGLMSFYTAGEDEARAWTIRKGSTAPQAARAIHTDLERGFIRAEVMKYDDLIALGSEAKVKEAGKAALKGKDYIVEDGDILNIRAST